MAEMEVRNSGGRRRCGARIAMGFFFGYVLKVISSASTGEGEGMPRDIAELPGVDRSSLHLHEHEHEGE